MVRALRDVAVVHADPLDQQRVGLGLERSDLAARGDPFVEQAAALLEIEVEVGTPGHRSTLEPMFDSIQA